MGRLVPGAVGLLFLASVVWSAAVNADGEAHKAMKKMTLQDFKDKYASRDKSNNAYRKNIVHFDRLMNLPDDFKDLDDKRVYVKSLLVAKTCFRDWVDDVECHMHVYERMRDAAPANDTAAKEKVKVDYKIGYESEQRLAQQIKDLEKISESEMGHYDEVLVALQKNFNAMVNSYEKELDEIVTVFSKHLESEEFDDILNSLENEMKSSHNITVGHAEMRHAVAKLAIADWVKAERTKSEHAGASHADRSKWEKMMNKIPNTLKYSTRGATPFVKEHLAKALDILGKQEWYEEAKSKSQAYLQDVANRMRHEAMKKSDTLIAQVMHAMKEGMKHSDMKF